MLRKLLACTAGALVLGGADRLDRAYAQQGRSTWGWQVSDDGGNTWRSGEMEVSSTRSSVLVRCVIGWSDPESGAYAFAGAFFDAVVVGLEGVGAEDFVRGVVRPFPFDSSSQTIVATRFGNIIKIDDSRDTIAPGAGSRSLQPMQVIEMYAGTRFSTANPVSVFEYELVLDGSLGVREITDEPLTSPTGCIKRSVRAYTTREGAQQVFAEDPCMNRHQVVWSPARVVVVACRADFNADRQLDFFDYLDFVAAFANNDTAADFNGDTQIDFFDYLDFVTAYDAGCA